jgi:hypothetical protein
MTPVFNTTFTKHHHLTCASDCLAICAVDEKRDGSNLQAGPHERFHTGAGGGEPGRAVPNWQGAVLASDKVKFAIFLFLFVLLVTHKLTDTERKGGKQFQQVDGGGRTINAENNSSNKIGSAAAQGEETGL